MSAELETLFIGDPSGLESVVPLLERMSPEYHAKEVDKVFRRAWLPVASTTDVPDPNCYVVADVPPLKASLIVIRGKDGVVRAFHNTCRHRGNRVVPHGDKGCKGLLKCGFHGWSYASDGRLVGVTDKSQFPGIDESKLGLVPVHAEVWEGYVFVNFDETPRWTLAEWLGKMHGEYRGYFDERVKIADYRVQVGCNWNVAINAFSEGYHSLFVHAKTLPDYQGGKGNPNRHRSYLELLERNARYTAQANPNHAPTPVEAFAYAHGEPMYPAFPRIDPGDNALPAGLNPGRNPNWGFDITEMFPTLILIAGWNWHANLWFWPIDHERTDIRVEFHAYRPERVGDHLSHAYFRARLREVFREDVGIMEAIDASMKAGAMRDIVLSKQEMLLQKHYAVVADMVASP